MRTVAYALTACAICGSGEQVELADGDAVRREVEALWAFHGRRLRADTPPARLTDRVAFSERPPLRIARCARCGFVYRNPIEQERELEAIYAADAPPRDTLRALHRSQRRAYRTQARRLLEVLGRRGDALEVGSYVGSFLAAARSLGIHAEGLDVNPDVNRFTRSLGFVVHEGELGVAAIARTFDAVAIWNCFDQLPDPRASIAAARRLLRPGGVLAIRVPNGAFYARLARAAGGSARAGTPRVIARAMLAHNNLLGFPYRFGFTPRSMARLLEETGFAIRRTVGDVLVPIADEYTRPWARAEERVLKLALRALAHRSLSWAPWFEVYAVIDR